MIVYRMGMRSRFRGLTERTGMIWAGPAGWAEWSPFVDYGDTDAAAWLRAADEAAEIGWPEPLRTTIPVNCTVPAIPAADAAALVGASGCRTAKVKVAEPGQDLRADLDRVAAVREVLGRDGRIRVDANGAWSTDQALDALAALSAYDLEYAEQPCRDTADLARVRKRCAVPIAADESIRRAADPYEVKRLDAADVAVLKVQPLGGVRACLAIASDIGLPVVVSSALESSIGIAAGLALAAALPDLPYACGLATVSMFIEPESGESAAETAAESSARSEAGSAAGSAPGVDLVERPLLPVDGAIGVPPQRLVPSDPFPASLRADPGRRQDWIDRLDRVRGIVDDRKAHTQ